MKIKKLIIITCFTSLAIIISSLNCRKQVFKTENFIFKALSANKLTAVTDYSSVSYFIYQGEKKGFQYEMLSRFAAFMKMKLEIITCNDIDRAFLLLKDNKADVIAMDLLITKRRKDHFGFSVPLYRQKQVLVQRIPEEGDTIYQKVRSYLALGKKKIIVQKGSAFFDRVISLQNEIGDTVYIHEDPENQEEQLIEMVANGDISYTVSSMNIALVNSRLFRNIDVSVPVSMEQNVAWAVNKNENVLLSILNYWLSGFMKTAEYKKLYAAYFSYPARPDFMQSDYKALSRNRISKYDKYIRKYSRMIRWDWRLLAALIYQESKFNPSVKGTYNSFGLMQFTPETAKKFGLSHSDPPEKQIEAGVKLLKWIDEKLPAEISAFPERIKFILASYNAGVEHISDARNLAAKYGRDKNLWTGNVDEFIKLKSKPRYYNDPVVKFGYHKGIVTYRFVNDIMARYEHYKKLVRY